MNMNHQLESSSSNQLGQQCIHPADQGFMTIAEILSSGLYPFGKTIFYRDEAAGAFGKRFVFGGYRTDGKPVRVCWLRSAVIEYARRLADEQTETCA